MEKNRIFVGPPGSGKTYSAKKAVIEAFSGRDSDVFVERMMTDSAIAKLRRTGILIILLQAALLLGSAVIYLCFGVENTLALKDIAPVVLGAVLVGDSFVMKSLLERQRK